MISNYLSTFHEIKGLPISHSTSNPRPRQAIRGVMAFPKSSKTEKGLLILVQEKKEEPLPLYSETKEKLRAPTM